MHRDRDVLYQKWIIEEKTHKEIAHDLECSVSAVEYWIREHELGRIKRELEATQPYNNKDILYEMYYLKNMTQKAIAEELGCTESVVERRIKKFGLTKRNYNSSKPFENRELMYQLIVKEDLTYEQAAEQLNCSMTAVRNWAINFCFPRDVEIWEEMDGEFGLEIVAKYQEPSCLIVDLAEEYKTTTYIIRKILDNHKVTRKTRSEIKGIGDNKGVHRTHSLNQDYFKVWSHNMAYMLGFIAADGCIFTNTYQTETGTSTANLLKINLQARDKEILDKFCKELEYGGSVKIYDVNKKDMRGLTYASFDVSSKILVDDIKRIGIKERKTFDLEFPENIPQKYEIDFIRGFFDGDGSVGGQYPTNSKGVRSKTLQIRTRIGCASESFMYRLQEVLQDYGLNEKRLYKSRSIYEVTYSTRESLKLYDLFYANPSTLHLKRKKDRFDELICIRESQLNSVQHTTENSTY